MNRFSTLLTAAILAALAAAGCSSDPPASIDVHRLSMQAGQSVEDFHMETQWAWHAPATAPDGWCRVMLNFPLPGSTIGRPVYVLFARFRPATGEHQFDSGHSEQAEFAHLSRTPGKLNELSMVTQGRMRTWWTEGAAGRRLAGRFDLLCGDDLRLVGQFTAVGDEPRVTRFEQGYLNSVWTVPGQPKAPATRPGGKIATTRPGRRPAGAKPPPSNPAPSQPEGPGSPPGARPNPAPPDDRRSIIMLSPTTRRGGE